MSVRTLVGCFIAVISRTTLPSPMRFRLFAALLSTTALVGLLAVPRALAVQIVASQDTWISELAPTLDTLGTGTILAMRSSNPANQNAQPYMQFDISSLSNDVFSASLNLTADQNSSNPSFVVHLYGGYEDDAGIWSETGANTPTWNTAALKFPDGVGLVTEIGDGSTLLDQWDLVPNGDTDDANAKVTFLGSVTFSAVVNATMSFSSAELVGFLNTARANGDTKVTFVLAAEPHAINSNARMYSREATDDLGVAGVDTLLTDARRPNLVITEVIPGDFDVDGDVDGADFVLWQTNFPTESEATVADGDDDGDVDGADFAVWQMNFPSTIPSPGAAPVPEPASAIVAMLGGIIVLVARRRLRE